MKRELDACALIEQSITKAFRKTLWKPFVEALKRYELIKAGDRIAVCISGGKDSMLLAKLLEQLQKHSDVPFELRYLVMDPGYRADNRALIEQNAALLRIPIEVFETNIFAAADNSRGQSPCYLCARMRRGALYHAARERGCNKIALGHHRSDVIETTVMGMLYGSQLQAMPPMLHSKNFPGMSLIRPMYCIREEDIVAWKVQNGLRFLQCACRFTEQCEGGTGAVQSKRAEVKSLSRPCVRRIRALRRAFLTAFIACAWIPWLDTRAKASGILFWNATVRSVMRRSGTRKYNTGKERIEVWDF